ncbi:hypothetical protein HYV79_03485 [Candidatus Woesearchaeota archaeon]|nr:hypothetical protein [Candidatus Woesearchaeota archaeon]
MGRFDTSLDIGEDLSKKKVEQSANNVKPDIYLADLEKKLSSAKIKKQAFSYKPIIAGVLCFVLAVFLLTQTYQPKIFSQFAKDEVAKNFGLNYYIQVSRENPEWSVEQKKVESDLLVEKFLKSSEGKKQLENKRKELLSYFQDNKDQTYIYNADSYYFLRLTQNLIKNGHLGVGKDDVSDNLRSAGYHSFGVTFTLFPYFIKWWHDITSKMFFLYDAAFSFPVLLGILSGALIGIILYSIKKNIWLALLGVFFMIIQPVFVQVFSGGNLDTQTISLFFTLIVLTCVAFFSIGSKATKILSLFGLIISLILYRYTWSGWFYILVVLFFSGILWSAFQILNGKKTVAISIIAASLILSLIFLQTFKQFFTTVLDRFIGLDIGRISFSSFITELQPLDWELFYEAVGGSFGVIFFTIAILGMFFLLLKNKKQPCFFELTIILLFLTTFAASFFAGRFIPYILPAYVIMFTITVSSIWNWRKLFLLLFFIGSVLILSATYATTSELYPFMHDGIVETGDFLKTTSNNSFVATWWDRGYLWQYAGERATFFDGATFDTNAFLFSYIFTQTDIDFARNLLWGAGCNLGQWVRSIDKEYLDEFISKKNLTKCNPEMYLVVDQNSFSFINLMYIYSKQKITSVNSMRLLAEKITDKKDYAVKVESISDIGIPTLTTPEKCEQIGESKYFCLNYIVDLADIELSGQNSRPYSLVLVQNGIRKIKKYDDAKKPEALVVFEQEKDYYAFFADYHISDSLLLRLFTGESISGFKRVYSVYEPERILTFKVDWTA